MKPVLAFEYILGEYSYVYHTDGDRILPPNKVSAQTSNHMAVEKNKIYVSYMEHRDPDRKSLFWYSIVASKQFANEEQMKDAIADITEDFKTIYNYLTKEYPYEKVSSYATCNSIINAYPSLDDLCPG